MIQIDLNKKYVKDGQNEALKDLAVNTIDSMDNAKNKALAMLNACFLRQNMQLESKTQLTYEEGKMHLEISNLKYSTLDGNQKELPGKLNLTFDVSDMGYKLVSLSVNNPLLVDICTSDENLKIQDYASPLFKSINLGTSIDNLEDAINSNSDEDKQLKDSAKRLLAEVIKAADKHPELHDDLAKKLDDTTYLIENICTPDDDEAKKVKDKIVEYKQEAKEAMGKRSKLKMVGGAMLLFAGAALCAVAAIASGPAAPLAAVGITAIGLGALSIFSSGHKKGVADAMHNVAIEADKSLPPQPLKI